MTDSRIEMIKFVLAFIALILVMLGIYTYTNQESEKTVPTPASVTQKVEVQETEEVLPQAKEVKEKTSSVKNATVKSPKVVSHKTSYEMADTEEIGKGLTLESIENADVSEEEKMRMISDLIYYNKQHNINQSEVTASDIESLMKADFEKNLVP